jgi:hypothetical protein
MMDRNEQSQIETREKKADLKDLNFKVDPEFHTKFKSVATIRRLSMKELLEECFQVYLQKHPL